MNTNKALETVGNIYFKALVGCFYSLILRETMRVAQRNKTVIFQKPSLSEHPANELGIGMDNYVKNKHSVFV